MENLIENISGKVDDLRNRGEKLLHDEQIQQRVRHVADSAKDFVKDHPLASVGAGLVLGFLLGKLFSGDE